MSRSRSRAMNCRRRESRAPRAPARRPCPSTKSGSLVWPSALRIGRLRLSLPGNGGPAQSSWDDPGMTIARWCAVAGVVGAGSLASGCGSGDTGTTASSASKSAAAPSAASPPATPAPRAIPSPASPANPAPRTIPSPAPTRRPADPAAVGVIRAWSSALRHGDVRGAARYFAIPSLLANGAGAGGGLSVITIRSPAEADAANSTLPCGAKLLSADQRGRYVNALFRLTNRPGPGGGCSAGAGQTARTNFVIKDGRIVEWIRAPDDPGDTSGAHPPRSYPRRRDRHQISRLPVRSSERGPYGLSSAKRCALGFHCVTHRTLQARYPLLALLPS